MEEQCSSGAVYNLQLLIYNIVLNCQWITQARTWMVRVSNSSHKEDSFKIFHLMLSKCN